MLSDRQHCRTALRCSPKSKPVSCRLKMQSYAVEHARPASEAESKATIPPESFASQAGGSSPALTALVLSFAASSLPITTTAQPCRPPDALAAALTSGLECKFENCHEPCRRCQDEWQLCLHTRSRRWILKLESVFASSTLRGVKSLSSISRLPDAGRSSLLSLPAAQTKASRPTMQFRTARLVLSQ